MYTKADADCSHSLLKLDQTIKSFQSLKLQLSYWFVFK